MQDFASVYADTISRVYQPGDAPAPDYLRPLLERLYIVLTDTVSNQAAIKTALIDLFSFLTRPEGRTNVNCWTVDLFFCLGDWAPNVELPDEFWGIIGDMGGALHDTIGAPEIAFDFESTPEQLLERTQALKVVD